MTASLTWLDHDPQARERALRVLSFFNARESRDELGLGAIRDSFADQLFPGTSTIQTRLRYMLFVPWIYQSLEKKRVPPEKFAVQAENLERALIPPLREAEDNAGVFGKRAGKTLQRLPSSVYWAGLGVWGIRLTPLSQDEYHRRIGEVYQRQEILKARERAARFRGDDIDDLDGRGHCLNWHPRLPPPPDGFLEEVDFALTREEAEFLRDRIQAACPGSLLAYLTLAEDPGDSWFPWEHPDYGDFRAEHKELLAHAKCFSEAMHGAALVYNFQLAQLAKREDLAEEHKAAFAEWAGALPREELQAWSLDRLWALTTEHGHSITGKTRRFVQGWVALARQRPGKLLDDPTALALVRDREMRLKGVRSRYTNRQALAQWSGYAGIGRLTYRWPTVTRFLRDLFLGLGRNEC